MKNFCKKMGFMLSVILILNTINVVFAATTDIENHWAEEAIQEGLDKGYFYSYDDNSFKPDQFVTRAEFLKFLNNAFGLKNKTNIDFKDVSKEDSYYEEIRKTVAAGYMSGKTKDSFDPNGFMTREEMATIIANIVPPVDSIAHDYIEQFGDFGEISDWSKKGVETAVFRGYVKGKPGGIFDPKGYLTRAEASTLIRQILTKETILKNDIILNDTKELEKLKNSIVIGNVTLSDKVKTSVIIDNCALLGNLVINGGKGIITVKQSIVNNVIVNNKNNVLEIVSSGNTRFNNVTLKTKAELKTDDSKVTTESIFKNVVEEKVKTPSAPASSTNGNTSSIGSDSSYDSGNSYNPGNNYIPTPPVYPPIPPTEVVLSAPANLMARDDSTVNVIIHNLIWDTVPNSSGYNIVIKHDNDENIIEKLGGTVNSMEITNLLLNNVEYTIKIKALGTGIYKDSAYSPEIKYTIITSDTTPEIPVELPIPTGLKVENTTTNIYNVSWDKVQNSIGYEIIIDNNAPITINSGEAITNDISKYLTESKKEYIIQIKALGTGKYTDSQYAKIPYTTPDKGIVPPSGDVEVPVISSLVLEDIISKKTNPYGDDELYKISLNLKWTHTGADSFVVSIKDGSNVKEVNVDGSKKELRLNQYITKRNTKYDVTVSAKKGTKISIPSTPKSYTTDNGCGDDNGFVFSIYVGDYYNTQIFAVSTQAQFEHLQQHKGDMGNSRYFIQMNDIDFNGKIYTKPIVGNRGPLFMIYDGQGFKVDNFSINSNESIVGVFGVTYLGGGVIKDFIVGNNVVITGGTNSEYVGAIVGYAYNEIYRCQNYANVNANSSFAEGGIGGLSGISLFDMQDCTNYGNITNTGTTSTGGLIGRLGGGVQKRNSNSGRVEGKGLKGNICGNPSIN